MELVARKFTSALLIVMALAATAIAGDIEAAKRDLRGAEMHLEEHQKRYEQARSYVERAQKHLEGVDAAARAPLDAQIADILRRARVMELESWRRTALSEIGRIFSFAENKLEGWSPGDTNVVDRVMGDVDGRLPEALGRENAVASLMDEDKVAFQARRTELLEACKRKKIETHFHSASERIDRIERSELSADTRASYIADVDANLLPAVVPQDDPRVRQLKARLEQVLAKQDQSSQAAAQAEKIKRAQDEWADKKRQFARDCPAWEHELVNEYARWRQTSSLNVDKAIKRHETAEEMLAEDTYKDAVQWFAADPAVVALVGEVTKWREEAGTKVCAAANTLLDEVEKHEGEDGLAPALQGLLTLLEQRTAGAPQAAATVARARAAVVSAGGTPTTSAPAASADGASPTDEDVEGESSGGGGFLKVLFGLVCCFGFLAVAGGVGFVAFKQMSAAKPPAPPA